MRSKKQLKTILSKGSLTGEEAGKLVLQDNWLVDHNKESLLTDKDFQAIKSSLKTTQDIQTYNSYIDLYKLVDYTLKDSRIMSLEAEKNLLLSAYQLSKEVNEAVSDFRDLYTPAIVTQKQYDELKAIQRGKKLQDEIEVFEFLELRSQEEYPEQWTEWEELPEDSYWIDFLQEKYPEQWKKLVSDLLAKIKEGVIKPYRKDSDSQVSLDDVRKALQEEIEDIYLSEKDLYEAGYPETIEYVDSYSPGFDEETSARPPGQMQSLYVAILQDPRPHQLDDRGYYVEMEYPKREKPELAENIATLHEITCEKIKSFLAMQAVIETISQLTGVNFSADMDFWYEELENAVHLYNAYLNKSYLSPDLFKELRKRIPGLKPLKLGKLKPTAKAIRYYRERMALALGDDWYQTIIKNMEFEQQEEPDTLAQEISEELKEELSKREKESGYD